MNKLETNRPTCAHASGKQCYQQVRRLIVDEDTASGFGIGLIVGVVIVVLLNALPWSYLAMAKAAVRDCESALPRNEKCIITAVPAGKGGES
jgi:hypothetical protein